MASYDLFRKATTMLVVYHPHYSALRTLVFKLPQWSVSLANLHVDWFLKNAEERDGRKPELRDTYSWFEYDDKTPHWNKVSAFVNFVSSSYFDTLLDLTVTALLIGVSTAGWGLMIAFTGFLAESYFAAKKMDPVGYRISLWDGAAKNPLNYLVFGYGYLVEEVSRLLAAGFCLALGDLYRNDVETLFQTLIACGPEIYYEMFMYFHNFSAAFGVVNALQRAPVLLWDDLAKVGARVLYPVYEYGLDNTVIPDAMRKSLIGGLVTGNIWHEQYETHKKANTPEVIADRKALEGRRAQWKEDNKGRPEAPASKEHELAENAWATTVAANFGWNTMQREGAGYWFLRACAGESVAEAMLTM